MTNDKGKKTVLVTGSSSGIGQAIAKKFAALGHNVMAHGIEQEAEIAEALADIGSTATGTVRYEYADLASADMATALVAKTLDAFGGLDILVNNAGIQKVSPIEDFPAADWERVRAITLDSNFYAIRAALPHMTRKGWGRVINVASAHGLRASPFKSAYVSAKHGVIGLTKTVALEVAEKGVTVNAICPGYVWTPLVEKQLDDQAKIHKLSKDEVVRNIMLAPQPTKQFVTVEEIAELAAYLASDWARSITGTAISIDGGWTAK